MKAKIHPKYYPNAKVICACGNTWTTGSTKELIRTDLCSNCHPFYTGEQRIVDTAGQVDRFIKRLERKDTVIAGLEAQRQAAAAAAEEERLAVRRGGKVRTKKTEAPAPTGA
ncbi:MAG: 50S ribosomal protein L31 [Anaerolineae bacterium]|nr:50S ribosomal protein L31 [Anaerolineae bacterium]